MKGEYLFGNFDPVIVIILKQNKREAETSADDSLVRIEEIPEKGGLE